MKTDNRELPTVILKARKTMSFYGNKVVKKWRNLSWPVVKPSFVRPIFVVGCSRSGTTAVYKTIGIAPGLASMQKESHEFWDRLHPPSENNWESHLLRASNATDRDRREVSRFFYTHIGAQRFVDKANQNCFRIPYLHALFPDAYFVYVKRDGRDNINSLIHGWKRPDEFGKWSQDLPAEIAIDNGTYTRWCFFIFPGWRNFLKAPIEEVCAQQWIALNQEVLDAKKRIPSEQWVELVYEDILLSAVETFREIYNKLELPFSEAVEKHCMKLVENPYNEFSAPRLEKWKQENPSRIERILPLISTTMSAMEYEL